jgi:hypothetical protein
LSPFDSAQADDLNYLEQLAVKAAYPRSPYAREKIRFTRINAKRKQILLKILPWFSVKDKPIDIHAAKSDIKMNVYRLC